MAFVHSLVKTEVKGKIGWCAPVELGEAAPHYISFVVPLNAKREFFQEYTCETIASEDGDKKIKTNELLREGKDSFVLHFGELDLWFTVRPTQKEDRGLPYIGKLEHADFAHLLAEIEPEEPGRLDRIFEEEDTFVIGCEPFAHYVGIMKLARKR